ncbi:MAG TPA: winged helix-turn-helix domain-containing protein, partial [Negativicutes bacterium]
MDITKMLSGIKISKSIAVPMYRQIANSLATKIQEGFLPAGTQLPPERELAHWFAVSRTTIINAYRLLEERELVATRIGSGTYVAELPSAGHQTNTIPWEQLFTPQY